MKYYSTNNRSFLVDFKHSVMHGLSSDKGLFMPETIPSLPEEFIRSVPELSLAEIGQAITEHLIGNDIPKGEISRIVRHAIQMDAPLVEVEDGIYSLELFHGPTLAFKDFGARFMAGVLEYFVRNEGRDITILTATSGDTGGAVANAFSGVEGVHVVILYPSGQVSDVQEKQLTTIGGNITALEVNGTFDDCQRLVKEAFMDRALNERYSLTSANSINIARLIPQSFYYFRAYGQLRNPGASVVFSVPSGNFGNLTAGILAHRLGLPVHRFIASTNINDIVPRYLTTSHFQPRPSQPTISNAMDVGDPSNFPRILDLYDRQFEALVSHIAGCSFTDEQTKVAIGDVFRTSKYLMDPHGAVAYLGLKKYFQATATKSSGIFLETAHPAKFADVVENAIGRSIDLPLSLKEIMKKNKVSIPMSNRFTALKEFLASR